MTALTVNGEVQGLIKAEVNRSGISQKKIANEAGISTTTLSQWLGGKYQGDTQAIDTKMRAWLRSKSQQATEARRLPDAPDWLATATAKSVLASLSYAQMAADIAIIYGGAGVGKTCTAKHYRVTNPNVWIATMTPSTASVATCLERVALAIGIEANFQGAARLEAEIIGRVADTGGLLIVDEAQHLGTGALEAVRSLHDAATIGVALMGNEQVYSQMSGGGARQAHFAQLFSRIGRRVRLNKPQKNDVELILDAWNVPSDGRQICAKIALQHGALRYLTKTLRFASMMSAGEGTALTKDHIKAAWASLGGSF